MSDVGVGTNSGPGRLLSRLGRRLNNCEKLVGIKMGGAKQKISSFASPKMLLWAFYSDLEPIRDPQKQGFRFKSLGQKLIGRPSNAQQGRRRPVAQKVWAKVVDRLPAPVDR